MAEEMAFNRFRFRGGETYRGVNAQEAGEELERIREKDGGQLHTESVVRAAAAKRSPIHGVFTWDDAKAGHQYRLWEARQFIRMVVVVTADDGEGKEAPAFEHVPRGVAEAAEAEEPAGGYYQSRAVLAESADEFEAVRRGWLSRLKGMQRGFAEFLELAPPGERRRVRRAARHVEKAAQAITP